MGHIEDRWTDDEPATRGRTRWRARVKRPDGGTRSRSFDRRVDAERWLRVQESAQDTGTWVDPVDARTTFGDWYERYVSTRDVRPSTAASEESRARNHVLPKWATYPLSAIQHLDVVEWVQSLTDDGGLSPATVHKVYNQFTGALDAAVDARLLPANPCGNVPLPRVERDEMRFLSVEQLGRLADAMDDRYRAWVLVAGYGGLRAGELAALTRKRLVPHEQAVQVEETLSWPKGELYVGPPKSKAGRRRVQLPGFVWDELEQHLEQHEDEYVFPAAMGGPMRLNNFRRYHWKPALEAADLEGLRIHDLRHTAISLWIAAGADIKHVATRAGHSSVTFTLDRYGHLYPDADAALMRKLDAQVRSIDSATGPEERAS